MKRNPCFESDLLPVLQEVVRAYAEHRWRGLIAP